MDKPVPFEPLPEIELLLPRHHETAEQVDVGVADVLVGGARGLRLSSSDRHQRHHERAKSELRFHRSSPVGSFTRGDRGDVHAATARRSTVRRARFSAENCCADADAATSVEFRVGAV
jgi:hypothetical protein